MKPFPKKIFTICGVALWLAATGILVCSGIEPDKAASFAAGGGTEKWDQFWKQGFAAAKIEKPGDELPTVLPGPMDAWGGGKEHGIGVAIQAAPGKYDLVATFHETHDKFPPSLTAFLNNTQIWQGKLPAGGGRPGPYSGIIEKATVRIPVTIGAGQNNVEIRNTSGSWAAPAEVYLSKGRQINLDKLAYRLFSGPTLLLSVAAAAFAGLIVFRMASGGLAAATAEAGLVAVSLLATAVCIEFGYRLYLKNRSELKPGQAINAAAEKGHNYSLMEMLLPTGDFDLPYLLKPGLDGFFYGKHVRTNSYGFRGPDIAPQKPANTLRIVGLGDSVLFGWGIDYEQTTLARLAELLQSKVNKQTQVINTAVPGYNTAVEAAVYEKAARGFSPDIVVLLFVENDFYYPHIMAEPATFFRLDKSYMASALAGYFGSRWGAAGGQNENWVTSAEFEEKKDKPGGGDRMISAINKGYEATTGKKAVESLIRRLGARIKEDGAIGVFAWPPFNVYPSQPKYDYPTLDERGYFENVAKEAGFLVPPMHDMFLEYVASHKAYCQGDILWLNENDSHPKPDAHQMIAQAIFNALVESEALSKLATK
ncbi:MAG: SGNH/GDSL hydrolase family protein [Nitrospinae bacterium]|nr:SGNH/GDSL hydrolase family protein [Nitrospinota bacterium]